MINESDAPHQQFPESETVEMKERKIQIPFPESFLYANCAAFSIGQNELRISFAEVMQDGRAVSKVGVVLPPETAAVIALVLYQQVQTFEENFGEIRHPMWKAMKAGRTAQPPTSSTE